MGEWYSKVIEWIENRTGVFSIVRELREDQIPASAGWAHTLGSIALFFFFLQIVTGVLLALYYAPLPEAAYRSVLYIEQKLPAGAVIRGLHHWGASAMVVIVAVHMLRTFLFGSYKKPREVLWMSGVFLLLVVLGFGLTGYLLPWDQRAYWGTVVTTQIMGSPPVLGPYVQRVVQGGDTVGTYTLSHFYTAHVILFPALLALLAGIHIYLLKRHGETQPWSPVGSEDQPKIAFHPSQSFRDSTAIFVSFLIVLAIALWYGAPLGGMADSTDTSYIPRPDWYFLFLFQALKVFPGPLEVVGSVILPTLFILLLLALPLLDRNPERQLSRRPIMAAAAALAVIGWTGLTWTAYVQTPISGPSLANLPPGPVAGGYVLRRANCLSCHRLGDAGGTGPELTAWSAERDPIWLSSHAQNPSGKSGQPADPVELVDADFRALEELFGALNPETAPVLAHVPDKIGFGAWLLFRARCTECHSLNGVGGNRAPKFNGVGSRHKVDWIGQQILNPRSHNPESIMNAYPFDPDELDALTTYLLSIQPQ